VRQPGVAAQIVPGWDEAVTSDYGTARSR
jgi:hypothetical protein